MKQFMTIVLLIVSSIGFTQNTAKNDTPVIETEINLPSQMDKRLRVTLPFFSYNTVEAKITQLHYFENQQLLNIKFEVDNDIHCIYLNNVQLTAQGFVDKDTTQKWQMQCHSKETELWLLFKIESLLQKKLTY